MTGQGESRRSFLSRGGRLAAGLVAAPGAVLAAAASRRSVASRAVVRRGLGSLAETDPAVRALKAAVASARKRAGRGGWSDLVARHAAFCAADGGHADAQSLPRHRAYLRLVERTLQSIAGDPRLALPYWDWTRDRRLPAVFAVPGSPLNDPTRRASAVDELPADLADAGPAMRAAGLELFAGSPRPEDSDFPALGLAGAGAAGNVRHWVGGNMADCAKAALDPLYLAHCANVDRLWEAWLAAAPERREMSGPFRTMTFDQRDETGAVRRYELTGLLDTRRLGYRYDDLGFQTSPRNEPSPDAARAATLRFSRSQLPELPLTFRVFLNNRNALASTRPEGSTYAGTHTLFPENARDGKIVLPLEVSAEMGHRAGVQATLSVTLVVLSLPGRPAPPRSIWVSNPELTIPAP